jgi:hypothetical protein
VKVQIVIPLPQPTNPADYLDSVIDGSGLVQVPNDAGLSIRLAPRLSRRAFPASEAIVLIAEFTSGVAAGVLSNWIYERLHGKSPSVIIHNRSVSTERKEQIERAISVQKDKVRKSGRKTTKRH